MTKEVPTSRDRKRLPPRLPRCGLRHGLKGRDARDQTSLAEGLHGREAGQTPTLGPQLACHHRDAGPGASGFRLPAGGSIRCDPPGAAHTTGGVVADGAHEVPVALAVGDLAGRSAAGRRGRRRRGWCARRRPVRSAADRHPIDAENLRDSALRSRAGKPHAGVFERPGEPRSSPGPRHLLPADPARRAADAADFAAQDALGAKHVEVPPRDDPPVIARCDPLTASKAQQIAATIGVALSRVVRPRDKRVADLTEGRVTRPEVRHLGLSSDPPIASITP